MVGYVFTSSYTRSDTVLAEFVLCPLLVSNTPLAEITVDPFKGFSFDFISSFPSQFELDKFITCHRFIVCYIVIVMNFAETLLI